MDASAIGTSEPEVAPETAMPSGPIELFNTPEGWEYALGASPVSFAPVGTEDGCIDTPPPGQTVARFEFTLVNLIEDRPAPVPEFDFYINLDEKGASIVEPAADTFSTDFQHRSLLETPELLREEQTFCLLLSSSFNFVGEIPAGGQVTIPAAFGPISENVPNGLAALVRVREGRSSLEEFLRYTFPLN